MILEPHMQRKFHERIGQWLYNIFFIHSFCRWFSLSSWLPIDERFASTSPGNVFPHFGERCVRVFCVHWYNPCMLDGRCFDSIINIYDDSSIFDMCERKKMHWGTNRCVLPNGSDDSDLFPPFEPIQCVHVCVCAAGICRIHDVILPHLPWYRRFDGSSSAGKIYYQSRLRYKSIWISFKENDQIVLIRDKPTIISS